MQFIEYYVAFIKGSVFISYISFSSPSYGHTQGNVIYVSPLSKLFEEAIVEIINSEHIYNVVAISS